MVLYEYIPEVNRESIKLFSKEGVRIGLAGGPVIFDNYRKINLEWYDPISGIILLQSKLPSKDYIYQFCDPMFLLHEIIMKHPKDIRSMYLGNSFIEPKSIKFI